MKQSVVSRGFASDPAGRVHGVPHSPKCIGAALNSVPRTTTSFLFWKLACLQTINISDTVACVFLPTSSFFVSPIRHSRVFIWMLPTRTYVDMNSDGTWTFRDIVRSANQCETNMAIDDWLIDWLIGLNLFRCLTLTFMTSKCTTSAVEKFKEFKEGITVKLDANPGHFLTWSFFVWLPWYSLLFYCPVWALSGNSRSFVANMFWAVCI